MLVVSAGFGDKAWKDPTQNAVMAAENRPVWLLELASFKCDQLQVEIEAYKSKHSIQFPVPGITHLLVEPVNARFQCHPWITLKHWVSISWIPTVPFFWLQPSSIARHAAKDLPTHPWNGSFYGLR